MKYFLFFTLFCPTVLNSQFGDNSLVPESWNRDGQNTFIQTVEVNADKLEIERLKKIEHASYICATAIATQIHFSDFTLAEILPNNDKVYRLLLKSPNALGLMVLFQNFRLEPGAKLWLYNKDRSHFAGMYSAKDNYQTNGEFLTSHVLGNEIIVEYYEPSTLQTNDFLISKVYHYFRGLKGSAANGFGTAGSCMINVACAEGHVIPSARDATCRIRVTGPSFSGYCTGTLINNTSEDRTPYILTANHCSAKSSLSDLINWEFDFSYQSSICSNPSIEPKAITYKGCTAPAYSGADNGEFSSDFLLLKLTSTLSTSVHDFTFLGWNRADSNFFGNYCYHHPKGDIKKVSTSLNWTAYDSYGRNVPNTHFSFQWTSTANGRSVTDEGSSGSALVNSNGLLIGTLTGGSALCTNLTGIDFYGRFFMHWDKFGIANDRRLKPWLDPVNTNATSLRSIKLSGGPLRINSSVLESDKLTIKFNEKTLMLNWLDLGYEVSLFNIQGQQVLKLSSKSKECTLDLSTIPQGFYFLEVIKDNKRNVAKFQL